MFAFFENSSYSSYLTAGGGAFVDFSRAIISVANCLGGTNVVFYETNPFRLVRFGGCSTRERGNYETNPFRMALYGGCPTGKSGNYETNPCGLTADMTTALKTTASRAGLSPLELLKTALVDGYTHQSVDQ